MLHAYSERRSAAAGKAPPVIKADPAPYKVKPASPGGRVIPDRDKRVYDNIASAEAKPRVERLLPAPEIPVPRPRPAEVEQTAQSVQSGTAGPKETAAPPAAGTPSQPAAKPDVKTPPKPPAASKAGAGSNYRLQLAALRSENAVQQTWRKLRRKHGDLLSRLELAVEKTDLGPPKGVFFRLLVGPLADRTATRKLCADLAKRGVDCFVVRR